MSVRGIRVGEPRIGWSALDGHPPADDVACEWAVVMPMTHERNGKYGKNKYV